MSAKAVRDSLRKRLEELPVVDCHEHTGGPEEAPEYKEPIAALVQFYIENDLTSAGIGDALHVMKDPTIPTEEKWPVFERAWRATEHTAYARVLKLTLKRFYGIEDVSLESLLEMKKRLLNLRDPGVYWRIVEESGVVMRLLDLSPDGRHMRRFIDGEWKLDKRDRLLIPLPRFHHITGFGTILEIGKVVDCTPTSLDEYVEVCREVFARMAQAGAVGMKDQSAYVRPIDYKLRTKEEAERIFNRILTDHQSATGFPEIIPLSDYLFHEFMRAARDLDLTVQLHTGHMAGCWNELTKTNAIHLTRMIDTHQGVRFDLFHGNWPYAGELLYLAKNYPNVHIDCCWVHIIDPRYSTRLLADSVGVVPHTKIHAFGGDYGHSVEAAAAHLEIARDNVAAALAEVVESGWITEAEALQIAADWFYNNPNEWFKLGLEPLEV